MFVKVILLAIFVSTVDQTFIEPVPFVGPHIVGGGIAPFPGRSFSPAGGIVHQGGDAPRIANTPPGGIMPSGGVIPARAITPLTSAQSAGGRAPSTIDQPSPGPRPIQHQLASAGQSTAPRMQQEPVRTVEGVSAQHLVRGPVPSSGGPMPPPARVVPPGRDALRGKDTAAAMVPSREGPSPPTEKRPSIIRSSLENPPEPNKPLTSPPNQKQNRSAETVRPQAVRRPSPSALGSLPPTGEMAPPGRVAQQGRGKLSERRTSPVPSPLESTPTRTGPSKPHIKHEQDRSVESVRTQTVARSPEPSAEGQLLNTGEKLPPGRDGEQRSASLGRSGDRRSPLTEGTSSPVSKPIEFPPKQEQDKSVETVAPKTTRGSTESFSGVLPPDAERRKDTPPALGRPEEGQDPPIGERPSQVPRRIQHPPVWTGPSKTPSKQQEQDLLIQHPPVWTGPQKSSPTQQQESERGPPFEEAAPSGVRRPTQSSRPIQHPPVWKGSRKTPPKNQHRQQEPAREQEIEEPPIGRSNVKARSNPLPITTPSTPVTTPTAPVPTNQPRIPFTVGEFAVTSPSTTVPPNPHRFQPCSIATICGSDGYTYYSECFLPNGVWKECAGSCPCPVHTPVATNPPVSACTCPQVFNPVCGVDGNTYDNDCWRQCNGEPKQCDSECPCTQEKSVTHSECVCNPYESDPVCTTDGETIWNGCEAMCAGKEIACTSTCPC